MGSNARLLPDQTIESKQKFISQIMSSKSPVRSCQDVDETVLSYAEIKALCSGNPAIREKMDLDIEVARLRVLKSEHQSNHFQLEDKLLKRFPESVEKNKGYIAAFERDIKLLAENTPSESGVFMPMEIRDVVYSEKEAAGKALLEACKMVKSSQSVDIGKYRGFDMSVLFDAFDKEYKLTLKGDMSHPVVLGSDVFGNLRRLDNALSEIPNSLKSVQVQLDNLYMQIENAKVEVNTPFPFERELNEKSARLTELNAELNMEGRSRKAEVEAAKEAGPPESDRVAVKSKPSILANLSDMQKKSQHINSTRETRSSVSCKNDIAKDLG